MNRKLLASAMTVGVLSAPVAMAVASTNDNENQLITTKPTAQVVEKAHTTAAHKRDHVHNEIKHERKARKKAAAHKRAKKRAKAHARAAAAQGQAPQTASAPQQQQQSGGGGNAGGAEQFAACESGGDPNAVNPTSGARGKYQILPSTHDSLCQGMGYGADCAARVYAAQGSGAWAQCGG